MLKTLTCKPEYSYTYLLCNEVVLAQVDFTNESYHLELKE